MDREEFPEDVDKAIERLIEMGFVEIAGYDSISDQFTYQITERGRTEFPDLFNEHMSYINQLAFNLWERGIIEMKFDVDGTPMVIPKDIEYTKTIMQTLEQDERFFLENLVYKYEQDHKDDGII
jgi:DNA-binding PadR family transcriptional regulator